MEKQKLWFIPAVIGLLALLSQCKAPTPLPATIARYFPHPAWLKEGIAQKYYFHYQRAGQPETWTNINYITYQWTTRQQLLITNYNTDFTPNRLRRVTFDRGQMNLLEDILYEGSDTIRPALLQPVMRNWVGDTATFVKSTLLEDYTNFSSEHQLQRRDTTVDNRPGMTFSGRYESVRTSNKDTLLFSNTFTETYVQGLGLYAQSIQSDRFRGTLELIEQMPMAIFRKRQEHGLNRVAYIDAEKTLGFRPDFELCTTTASIIDYYNPDPDIHYRGGKYALWQAIRPKIKPAILEGVSGYLTFRFVVNCRGQTGRFVLEATSLDFQPAQFPKTVIGHLGTITAGLKDWEPGVLKGEPADAYAYLTYKLKDGELVELLP